jgi:hypothetical protein
MADSWIKVAGVAVKSAVWLEVTEVYVVFAGVNV